MGFRTDPVVPIFTAFSIPTAVTSTVATHRITNLYPTCRPRSNSETVRCLQLKNAKNSAKFGKEAKEHFPDGLLDSDSLVFCGLSLSTLELCLAFFVPFIKASSLDNEFGPGIYVTSNMEVAKDCAGSNGAIMVFQKPDERDLAVWKPTKMNGTD
ncbi:hypothetical protein VTN96DRAFT_6904 [Rasamsonia emersonii]